MGPRDASTLCRLDAAQSQFQSHKDKYEKLRADVAIKLKFLEENKVGRDVGLGRGCGAQSGGLLCTRVPWPCCLAAACLRSVFGWAAAVRQPGDQRGRAGECPSLPASRCHGFCHAAFSGAASSSSDLPLLCSAGATSLLPAPPLGAGWQDQLAAG